jgi:hypothetical protein
LRDIENADVLMASRKKVIDERGFAGPTSMIEAEFAPAARMSHDMALTSQFVCPIL